MFHRARAFDSNISGWDVSSVTNMESMFRRALDFSPATLDWDVSSVTDMNRMFAAADAFNPATLDWDVSSVTDMFGMFADTVVFDSNISGWDVSSVTNMSLMFQRILAFNQDLGDWNLRTAGVNMTDMFNGSIGMSQENMSLTLVGWATYVGNNGNLPSGVHLKISLSGLNLDGLAAELFLETVPVVWIIT